MPLKFFKPTTPSTRQLVLVDKKNLWKGKPEKTLTSGKKNVSGHNNHGRITSWHRGGGHKRKFRIIDFKRTKYDISAVVKRIEYDPNRTAFIALIEYSDNELAYILAPQKLNVGDAVISSLKADIKPGNAMLLKNIPVGTIIHNIEMKPEKGAQLVRSAGCFAQLVGRDANYSQIRLSSGELRYIPSNCMASIGALSNVDQKNINLGKAGRSRWLGRRPHVRGVAMNPIDHPHGGGEGRTSGGRHPVTPWGVSTKGKRTRNNKSTDKYIIRKRYAK